MGKPNPGTDKDRRLKENKTGKAAAPKAKTGTTKANPYARKGK